MQTLIDFGIEMEKPDVLKVIQDLRQPCHACRLGMLNNGVNWGLIYRGNPMAKIACLSEMPAKTETKTGKAISGNSGIVLENWMRFIKLNLDIDCFTINVVNCQTPNEYDKSTRTTKQRTPEKDEIATCFPNRTLPVLQAMPNLEVIMTLGWVGARVILGGEPKDRTHTGQWYKTHMFPGIPVFCLPHPAYLLHEPNPEKEAQVKQCLKNFKREYLDTRKVLELIKNG